MLAWIRFRPYFLIAGWLLALLVIVNGVLRLLDNTPVLNWLPKVTAGTGFLEDNRQRVEGAEREYEEGRVKPGESLCAIIGLSNVREAVPLKVVSEEAGLSCRYLGLGAAGVGMPDFGPQARLLLESELRPDLVLLGIGPHQLLDTRPKPSSIQLSFLESLKQGDFRNAAIAIRDGFWFFSRRNDVTITLENHLLDARAALFQAFGVHLQEATADRRSPWREMIRTIFAEHFSEATLREEEQFFQDLGAFDRETYTHATKAPSILIQLVRDFRARCAVVVVVLMPENSRLRKRMPPNLPEVVSMPLRRAFGEDMPPILDLRDAVEDSGFVDLTHLNAAGSAQCGQRIGAKIHNYLPRSRTR